MAAPHLTFQYYLTVDHVHDGDTIMGTLDLGLRLGLAKASVRLAGVNAPELAADGGPEARDYVMGLVQPGDVLRVVSESWEHDNYGRIIGTVYLADGDPESLNDKLLQSGHAVPYPGA